MSLKFNYKRVENWEAASTHPCYPDDWHPIGNALVWMSMVCGYNEITEKNATKVAQRLMEYQALKGPLLEYTTPDENGESVNRKLYIDTPEVQRYIGLTTNASPMTDREWNKKLLDLVSTEAAELRYYRRNSATTLVQFAKDCEAINAAKKEK